MQPRVKNKRTDLPEAGDVYVGRPSKWGNPFPLQREADRFSVLGEYAKWLAARPALMLEAQQELRGKNLVCWCSPAPCHAGILLAIANLGS